MNGINLIPPAILDARRRRRRIRAWSFATAAYAVILAGSFGAYASGGIHAHDTGRRMAELAARLEQERAELNQLRDRAAEAQREADAARMMAGHPNWSVLLALLAGPLGPDMTLDACELAPIDPPPAAAVAQGQAPAPPPPKTPAGPGAYRVTVTGLARTQSQVTAYTLALERLGGDDRRLFDHVTLVEAKGRRVGSTDAVAFRIEGALNARPARRSTP